MSSACPHCGRPLEVDGVIAVGALRIDTVRRTVDVDGELVEGLTPTQFALLAFLAREPDRFFSAAELLREVWGWEHAASARTNTVSLYASSTRRRLGGRFVFNRYGVGYSLLGGAS